MEVKLLKNKDMLYMGIIAILLGLWMAISNIKDIIIDKKESKDEGFFDKALIIKGIGLIIMGIMVILWSLGE